MECQYYYYLMMMTIRQMLEYEEIECTWSTLAVVVMSVDLVEDSLPV